VEGFGNLKVCFVVSFSQKLEKAFEYPASSLGIRAYENSVG
jgi:hypothetical protein